jgi:hypothetical protein
MTFGKSRVNVISGKVESGKVERFGIERLKN